MQVGLFEVVERGDLRVKSPGGLIQYLVPSGFDAEVLTIADAAIRHRVPTGIIMPVGGTRAAAIIGAAVLVHHVATTREMDAIVTLVSRQLDLRTFYRSLHIETACLADCFPLATVLPDGKIATAKKTSGRKTLHHPQGKFLVSIDLSRIRPDPFRSQGLIIEAGAGTPERTRDFLGKTSGKIPFVYLTTSPLDPVLDLLSERGAVWAWTPQEIGELSSGTGRGPSVCVDPFLLQRIPETLFNIRGPERQDGLDLILPRLWDDLLAFQSEVLPVGSQELSWAWAVTGALSGLVVPLRYYERHAALAWRTITLSGAPDRARMFARNALSKETREYWQILAFDFEDALQATETNTKPVTLVRQVGDTYRNRKKTLIVVRNRAAVAAVEEYLDDEPKVPVGWRENVTIDTFARLERGRVEWCESTLFAGPPPGSQTGLVATPAAAELTILTHGPWEMGLAERRINRTTEALARFAGGEARTRSYQILFGQENVECVFPPVRIPVRRTVTPVAVPRTPVSAREVAWNPIELEIAQDVLFGEDTSAESVNPSEGTGREPVEAVCVIFRDGTAFFEPHTTVSRIRGGEEKDAAAKSLRSGDRVVLVDRSARTDLFGLVVTRLEQLPEFAATAALAREWQVRSAKARNSGLTVAEILKRMQTAGSKVTTVGAVSHWLHGRVLGPEDPEDIRRFGEAVGDDFLVKNYSLLHKSLNTLRRHRRKVGRQLAKVLGSMAPDPQEDAYFDSRLGIHLSEFTDAVTCHEVTEVLSGSMVVPRERANLLLDPAEGEHILTVQGAHSA